MAIFQLPTANKEIKQVNSGEVFGNVWSSFNLDVSSNPGKIRIGKRTKISTDSATTANFSYPWGFAYRVGVSGGQYIAGAGTRIWKGSSVPTGNFAQDAISGTPTDLSHLYSDMVMWNDEFYVTSEDEIYKLSTLDAWSNFWTSTLSKTFTGNAAYPHPLCVSFNNLLLVGDVNNVKSVTIGNVVDTSAVHLPQEQLIVWMRSSSDAVWIGTVHKTRGNGYVYEWDGASTNFNRQYDIGATGALSCEIVDDIPYVMNSNGELKRFNGNGFQTIAQLPSYDDDEFLINANEPTKNNRFIHPRGMSLVGGQLKMLINNKKQDSGWTNTTHNEPSGIWTYSDRVGLSHESAIATYKTGTPTDYGSNFVAWVGALFPTHQSDATYIAGASIYTDDASTELKIAFNDYQTDDIPKRAYLITPKFYATSVKSTFTNIYETFKRLSLSTDRIITKVKKTTSTVFPFVASITWTSTTTFSSIDSNFGNVVGGEEVEIMMGDGNGGMASVVSVTYADGTYTITIDTALGTGTGTAKARLNNFVTIKTITNQLDQSDNVNPDHAGEWIQVKIELRGTGDSPELDQLLINEQPLQLIV